MADLMGLNLALAKFNPLAKVVLKLCMHTKVKVHGDIK